MSERKISECISIRINVGNYQHIELTKYAEEQIEYSTPKERMEKEDELRDDLVASIVRSMKAIPEKLGKGIEAAIEVEESIKKAIPEWMEKEAVPNLANTAKKKEIQNEAEQKEQKKKAEDNLSEVLTEDCSKKEAETSASSESDLFEEDEMPEPKKVDGADDPIGEEESKEADDGFGDDFFDDDDLFDD